MWVNRQINSGLFVLCLMSASSQIFAATQVGLMPGEYAVEQGAARYTIPIDAPEGLAGLRPELAITYSSQSGDGPLGVGWSISGLSIIHRCPRTKAQDGAIAGIKFDSTDRFCLDGQRLVPANGSNSGYGGNGKEYRTEIDNFSRITSIDTLGSISGPEEFLVETKDGRKLRYALRSSSRIMATGPNNNKLLVWALGRVEDRSGNYMDLVYEQDAATGEYRIDYIDYAVANSGTAYSRITFDYQSAVRPDAITRYISGSKVSNPHLLQQISLLVYKSVSDSWGTERNYQLAYGLSATKRTRLSSVKECKSSGNDCFSPTTLHPRGLSTATFDAGSALGEDLYSNAGRDMLVLDYNGDGFSDVLLRAKQAYSESNQCTFNGVANTTYLLAGGPSGLGSAVDITTAYGMSRMEWSDRKVARVLDINGDGLSDILVQGDHRTKDKCSWTTNGNNGTTNYVSRPQDTSTYLLLSNGSGFTKSTLSGSAISEEQWSNAHHALHVLDRDGDGDSDVLLQGGFYSYVNSYTCGNGDNQTTCNDTINVFGDTLLLTSTGTNFNVDNINASFGMNASRWRTLNNDLYILDINGDGLQDILTHGKENPGSLPPGADDDNQSYLLIAQDATATSAFESKKTLSGSTAWGDLSQNAWSERRLSVMDNNGDGLSDVLLQADDDDSTYLLTSEGTGFTKTNVTNAPGVTANLWDYTDRIAHVLDYDGDGFSDILLQGISNDGTYIVRSTGDGFEYSGIQFNTNIFEADDAVLSFVDADGNGLPDIVLRGAGSGDPAFYYKNETAIRDLLATAIDGFGHQTAFLYKPLTDSSVYTNSGTPGYLNTRPVQMPMYVVSELQTSDGLGGYFTTNYHYTDLRIDEWRRKSMGFAEEEIRDNRNKFVTTITRFQNFPYTGMISEKSVKTFNGQDIEKITNQVDRVYVTSNISSTTSGASVFPFVASSTHRKYELGDADPFLTTITTYAYQSEAGKFYGNLTNKVSSRYSMDPVATAIENQIKQHQNISSSAVWCPGRVSSATTTYSANGSYFSGGANSRETDYVWNASSCLLSQEISEPNGAANEKLTTSYQYSNGIVSRITQSGHDHQGNALTDRVTNISVNIEHYNRTNETVKRITKTKVATNSAGQNYTHTSTDYIGLMHGGAYESNVNGVIAQSDYDDFGRKTKETRADGTFTNFSYQQCNSPVSNCYAGLKPNDAYFGVVADDSIAGETVVYQDQLGRELRTISNGFDGRLVYKDSEYQSDGRLSGVTRPYFGVLGEPGYWTRYFYDGFGRVTRIHKPKEGSPDPVNTSSANYVTFEKDYMGLETRETNELLQDITRTKNVFGKLVKVEENEAGGGTVEYVYSAAGDLLTAMANGSNAEKITLTYDDLGRKLSIDDPNMGDWAYAYNSFGELERQIDAKGQQANMAYDQAGRLIQRLETLGEQPATSIWEYDSAELIGALAKVTGTDLINERNYSYDPNTGHSLSETIGLDENEDGAVAANENHAHARSYNSQGQLQTVTYPTGLKLTRIYDTQGQFSALYKHADTPDGSLTPASLRSDASNYANQAVALRSQADTEESQASTAFGLADEQWQDEIDDRNEASDYASQAQGHLNDASVPAELAKDLLETYAYAVPIMVDDITSFFYIWTNSIKKAEYDAFIQDATYHYSLANADAASSQSHSQQADAHLAAAEGYYESGQLLAAAAAALDGQARSLEVQAQANEISAQLLEAGQLPLSDRFWLATNANASQQLSGFELGNGVTSKREYDAATSWVTDIFSGKQGVSDANVQNLIYEYDEIGNLKRRENTITAIDESFSYDGINRLTESKISGQPSLDRDYLYAPYTNGNIQAFGSATNTFQYGAGNAGPYAVTSGNGLTYNYDDNGNFINDTSGRAITWTHFNKPRAITKPDGAENIDISFNYDADHNRIKQTAVGDTNDAANTTETTFYLGGGYEKVAKSGGIVDHKHYLSVPGTTIIWTKVVEPGQDDAQHVYYSLKDHLGSTDVTVGSDAVPETSKGCDPAQDHCEHAMRFGAFGETQNAVTGAIEEFDDTISNRGYTGHEMLAKVGLVHMNGRIYDPSIGRFLSPDPFIQAPEIAQNFNRYSYVLNNPLKFTDPSGYHYGDYAKPDIRGGDGYAGSNPGHSYDAQGTPGAPSDPIGRNDHWHFNGNTAAHNSTYRVNQEATKARIIEAIKKAKSLLKRRRHNVYAPRIDWESIDTLLGLTDPLNPDYDARQLAELANTIRSRGFQTVLETVGAIISDIISVTSVTLNFNVQLGRRLRGISTVISFSWETISAYAGIGFVGVLSTPGTSRFSSSISLGATIGSVQPGPAWRVGAHILAPSRRPLSEMAKTLQGITGEWSSRGWEFVTGGNLGGFDIDYGEAGRIPGGYNTSFDATIGIANSWSTPWSE